MLPDHQANKLPRSSAVLLEALNRHRGKGQQKVTVERDCWADHDAS